MKIILDRKIRRVGCLNSKLIINYSLNIKIMRIYYKGSNLMRQKLSIFRGCVMSNRKCWDFRSLCVNNYKVNNNSKMFSYRHLLRIFRWISIIIIISSYRMLGMIWRWSFSRIFRSNLEIIISMWGAI